MRKIDREAFDCTTANEKKTKVWALKSLRNETKYLLNPVQVLGARSPQWGNI